MEAVVRRLIVGLIRRVVARRAILVTAVSLLLTALSDRKSVV